MTSPRRLQAEPERDLPGLRRRDVLALAALGVVAGSRRAALAAAPQSELTWGLHVSLAPNWFDPADTQALITPFMVLYALHDAMVKPMPGTMQAPSLAEAWSMSEDGLAWDFTLRDGVKFHNGEPVTAADVKFSFERYRGAASALMKERVAAIEARDARHVRFQLHKPWPDFLSFYSTASGAGWIVPKAYVEKVGDDGFRKQPIGAGPYKFVSYNPGIELVLEAFEGYWRKKPAVKRLVMRMIPDESTRLAALKGGEIDIAYSIRGDLAKELQQSPGLTLNSVVLQATNWIYFPDQWDPKSPWHDQRVRQAANLALDRDAMNEALFLGGCQINNSIIPDTFDYYWQPPPAAYDPGKARKLLAEAGFPNGFDRSSAPAFSRLSATRNTPTEYCAERAAPSAMPRRGWLPSSSRTGPTSTAAIPTSTRSTRSRPRNSIRRSGPRSLKRCSFSSTRRRSSRRSGNSPSSTVSARGSARQRSERSPAFPTRRRSRTSP